MELLSATEDLRAQLETVGLFIVTGVTKSGTTWLQRLLNSHPEVACGGESKLHRLFTQLAPAIREYNDILTQTNAKIYKDEAFYQPLGQAQLLTAMQYFFLDRLAAVRQGATESGKAAGLRWIGDKDPDYKRDMGSWRAILPEARVISTTRDGRDCFVSLWFHLYPERDPMATENRSDFLGRIPGHATTWRDTMVTFQQDAKDFPGRHFSIRYEHMLEDTARELTALFGWLDCDTTPATITDVVERNSFQALSGGREPGEADARSFLRKGIAGDWKNHFDEECNARYCEVAGEALAAAGYEA